MNLDNTYMPSNTQATIVRQLMRTKYVRYLRRTVLQFNHL